MAEKLSDEIPEILKMMEEYKQSNSFGYLQQFRTKDGDYLEYLKEMLIRAQLEKRMEKLEDILK